ncbi:ComF family protein [Clostridia bacterium]|nr:ComF family protein [Clostridia bacterium]
MASYKDFRQVHLKFKYGGQTQLAKTMAMLMLQAYLGNIPDASQLPALITYVPSTGVRVGQRGYNTAELLAKWLGRYMDRPVRCLLKRKNSPKQTNLATTERRENIHGVFTVNQSIQKRCINFEKQRVLLVDDVFTSGATMTEAVCTLSACGYAHIVGICFLAKH